MKAKEKSQEKKTGDIPRGGRLADYVYHYLSPLGGITLSSNGTELTGLWFDGQKYFGNTLAKEYAEQARRFLNRRFVGLIHTLEGKRPILPRRF